MSRGDDLRRAGALVALCLLTRLPGAIFLGAEVADIKSYRVMAEYALRGENVYHRKVLFPYSPLTLPIPAASLWLAERTGLPFHLAIKLWPIAADCGLALLVWLSGRRRGWDERAAWLGGLAYALSPVAILTSAFHGNHTLLGVLFAFWACFHVTGESGVAARRYRVAALLLGLGVAARSFPVLLAPVFAILLPLGEGGVGLKRRLLFLALVGLPTALASIPAIVLDAPAYVRELTTYSGFADQGWLAIRRAIGVVQGTGRRFPPDTEAWLRASKWIFFALYGALLAELVRGRRAVELTAGCLMAWLLFLTAYAGVSTHYLVWVVPFGLFVSRSWTHVYSAAATLSMVGFYLTWFPGILLGRYAPPRLGPAPAAAPEWRLYLAALVVLWVVSAAWLLRTLNPRPFTVFRT